jgi:hypothetical protein
MRYAPRALLLSCERQSVTIRASGEDARTKMASSVT